MGSGALARNRYSGGCRGGNALRIAARMSRVNVQFCRVARGKPSRPGEPARADAGRYALAAAAARALDQSSLNRTMPESVSGW